MTRLVWLWKCGVLADVVDDNKLQSILMPLWPSRTGAHMVQEHMQRVFIVFRYVQDALE